MADQGANKPTLLLHIGFPKCGSTDLQKHLKINQHILRNRGIALVDQDLRHPGNLFGFRSRHLPEPALRDGRQPLTIRQREEIYQRFEPSNREMFDKYMPDTDFEAAFGGGSFEGESNVSDDLATALARSKPNQGEAECPALI